MNQLTIIGNLTRDPETRTVNTANGQVPVTSFTVAVNRQGQRDKADYFKVNAWRGLGDVCGKYLAKGRKVAVTGTVSVTTYTGQDGLMHASMDVTAEDVEFLTAAQGNGQAAAPAPQQQGFTPVVDDSLPF